MNPKRILRILAFLEILLSISLFIFKEFYLTQITVAYEVERSILVTHLFYVIITLSLSISTLVLFSSYLNNKSARIMLLANGIGSCFILISLFLLFFFTPFRPPIFILFILICFIYLSFIFYRNTNYDLLD
jgi:hypothetical protein